MTDIKKVPFRSPQQWVVDAAAYDETVVVGQACRRCGKAK